MLIHFLTCFADFEGLAQGRKWRAIISPFQDVQIQLRRAKAEWYSVVLHETVHSPEWLRRFARIAPDEASTSAVNFSLVISCHTGQVDDYVTTGYYRYIDNSLMILHDSPSHLLWPGWLKVKYRSLKQALEENGREAEQLSSSEDPGIHVQIQSLELVSLWEAAVQSLQSMKKRCLREGAFRNTCVLGWSQTSW